ARGRASLARWLRNPDYRLEMCQSLLARETWNLLSKRLDRTAMAEWADQNAQFLHPNHDQVLEIDDDLAALGVKFDSPEFFNMVLADLSSADSMPAERAKRLLDRYVPNGPSGGDASTWASWWKANQNYAFASDAGDYRWYVDTLAKKRGIPISEMRGPRRASVRFSNDTPVR